MYIALGCISVIIHIIIHEAGHYFAGRLSGYKFVSFRVFQFTFVRENGRIKVKKYHIPGSGGQCLMKPPERREGTYPTIFYNLGGSLLNFAVSAVTLYFGWYIFALPGFAAGLLNIIPMKFNSIPNDGYNALTLWRKPKERTAFWLLLRINAMATKGRRLSEMPAEWVEMLFKMGLEDVLSVNAALYRFNYLLEINEIEKAREFGEYVINNVEINVDFFKNEITCALIFLEIINERRIDIIEKLYTDKINRHIKTMKIFPCKQRLLYAYAKLVSRDSEAADAARRKFIKNCAFSPFKGAMECERILMKLVDALEVNINAQ